MELNEFGKIAHNEWLNSTQIRDNIKLHDFIVMPDHFHAIIEIIFKRGNNEEIIGQLKSPSHTIGSIIRGYKIATTKQIKELYLLGKDWDRNNKSDCRTSELQFAINESPTKENISKENISTEYLSKEMPSNLGELQLAPTGRLKIWQRNYYEHIIRNEKSYYNISKYIRNNPAKWTGDKFL